MLVVAGVFASTGAEAAEIVFDDAGKRTLTLADTTNATRVATEIGTKATIAVKTDGNTLATGGKPQNHGIDILSADGANPGEIDLSKGSDLVFDADLTDLEFDNDEGPKSGSMAEGVTAETLLPRNYPEIKESTAFLYWKDRTLADIKTIRAMVEDYNGGSHNCTVAVQACYFTNDGTTATAVFQFHGQIVHVMTAKVELKQVGDDITIQLKSVSARYNANDEGDSRGDILQPLYDGTKLEDERCPMGFGFRAFEAGELKSNGGKGVAVKPGYTTATSDPVGTTSALYWRNLKLADLEGVCGIVNRGDKAWAIGTIVSRTDDTMVAEFQGYRGGSTGHIMFTRVELTQQGSDIYAKKIKSGVAEWHENAMCAIPCPIERVSMDGNTRLDFMMPILKKTLAVNGRVSMGGKFGLGGATVKIGSPVVDETFLSTGTGVVNFVRTSTSRYCQGIRYENDSTGDGRGLTVFDGCYASITAGKPSLSKLFIITNNAMVVVKDGNQRFFQTDDNGGDVSYYIYPGSELQIPSGNPAYGEKVYIYGGKVKYNGWHWFGIVHFSNGGLFYGDALRLDGSWFAKPMIVSDGDGTTTNEISADVSFEEKYVGRFTLFACRGDDMLISGNIVKMNNGLFRKGGSKKLILAGAKPSVGGRVEVTDGPLRQATVTALTPTNTVQLRATASLEIAAGVASELGGLAVTNTTTAATSEQGLVLEEGASLALPADGLALENGAQLLITGTLGAKQLRVGTSRCVPAATLQSMRWVAGDRRFKVCQDGAGYIVSCGTMIIVR